MSVMQGGGLIHEQFPSNTTPARGARTSVVMVDTELQRVDDLLVNYVRLIIIKHYFIHKVKKEASIIIQMNQPH